MLRDFVFLRFGGGGLEEGEDISDSDESRRDNLRETDGIFN